MNVEDPQHWQTSFQRFFEPFALSFKRSETRQNVQRYVRGLLADVPRKNGWQLAESVGLADPHPLQRLLNEAQWEATQVQAQRRHIVIEALRYEPGIGVVDESGFVKWGKQSAGVGRQYCGRMGKVENCQVGVFLGYVTATSAAFLDCQLYLPQAWCADRERCRAAAIPDAVAFQTKPQIALGLLERSWQEGIPMQWVVGDTLYGNSPDFRRGIHQHQRYYVLGLGTQHQIELVTPSQQVALSALPQQVAAHAWEQLCFRIGEKGLIWYEWHAMRVQMPNDDIGEQWLLLQRTVTAQPTYHFYLSNAPADTPLVELAAVALARHPIEELLEEAKSEVGMADYEVRQWHAWHRHMALVMLAHTWLKLIQHTQREKKATPRLVELQPG